MNKHTSPQLGADDRLSGQEPMLGTRLNKRITPVRQFSGTLKAGLYTFNGVVSGTFGADSNPQRVIATLCQSLQHDDRLSVRKAAAIALGRIGGMRAVLALSDALLADDDYSLCLTTTNAMGLTKHPLAVAALCTVLKQEEPQELHIAVLLALGRIGEAHTQTVEDILPVLVQALQTGSHGMREAAFKALAAIRDTASLDVLLSAIASKEAATRQAAASMLGWQRRIEAIPELLFALRDDDSDVRRAAGDALITIGDSRAIPGLLDACRDADRDVRAAAAYTLEHIGSL